MYSPQLFADINPGGGASVPFNLTVINGTLLFSANDGQSGFELWGSDGTPSGTGLIQDIFPGWISSLPFGFTPLGYRALFVATHEDQGRELWITDGTAAGTYLIADLVAGAGSGSPTQLTHRGGVVFFVATDDVSGDELWVSNGLEGGSGMVADINPGGAGSFPQQLTPWRQGVIFSAFDESYGAEPWFSDGTSDGTFRLVDLNPGTASSLVQGITPLEDDFFFSAEVFNPDRGVSDRELWVSDGTAEGTYLVKDINSGGSSTPNLGVTAQGNVFFTAEDGITGRELWVSDGTPEGTKRVADVNPGQGGSNPLNLTLVGDLLFFSANDGSTGRELWVLDTTTLDSPSPTLYQVADINPGLANSAPNHLTAFDGQLFFSANDGLHGPELWVSDGTLAGTQLVLDMAPGPVGSFPSEFAQLDNTLFFTANDGQHGTELWSLTGIQPQEPAEIQFDNFSMVDQLMLNGSAAIVGSALRLTPAQTWQAGSAFYDQAFTLEPDTSFTTQFQMHIGQGPEARGADGFVFAIQSSSAGSRALGRAGGRLGYGGIRSSLAIEFDTFGHRFDGGNDNHIAILQEGRVQSPLMMATPAFDLNGGAPIYGWIDYNGLTDRLEVFLAETDQKPDAALLSTTLDLASLFDGPVYFGFTAATGGAASTHDLLSWELDLANPIAVAAPTSV